MAAYYSIPLNDIYQNSLEKIDSWLIPLRQGDPREISMQQNTAANWIDVLGKKSAQSQGLKTKLTSSIKFKQSSDQQLYIYIDRAALNGTGEMAGILRTGMKKLYFYKSSSDMIQRDTDCVLDFYVEAHYQRHGIGKKLYDFMLEDKKIAPHMLAIDRPSPLMMNFQKKHYGLSDLTLQQNYYAVTPQFFDNIPENEHPIRAVQYPVGRYAANERRAQIASVLYQD